MTLERKLVAAKAKASKPTTTTAKPKAKAKPQPKTQLPSSSPDDDEYASKRQKYDYIRNQSINLKAYLETRFSDGALGETSLEVPTFFFDTHNAFAAQVFLELQLPQAIEAEVITGFQLAVAFLQAYVFTINC